MAKKENNMSDYPNWRCFGSDLINCDCLDSCPDYNECKEYFFKAYMEDEDKD